MNSNEPSSGIAPMTPADCDLQDFQYMPLDKGAKTPEEWMAAK